MAAIRLPDYHRTILVLQGGGALGSYRDSPHEVQNKDYQFSLGMMRNHWQTGLTDIQCALKQPQLLDLPDNEHGFVAHDVHREEIEQVYDSNMTSLNTVKR